VRREEDEELAAVGDVVEVGPEAGFSREGKTAETAEGEALFVRSFVRLFVCSLLLFLEYIIIGGDGHHMFESEGTRDE